MVREELDAFLVVLAVGDVDGNADVVGHGAALALAHGRHHEPGRVGLARAAAKPHLALPGFLVGHGAADLRRQRLATGLFQQRAHAFADEFVEVVVRAAAERLVHADDLLLGVHDDDALGRGLEHLGPQLQALLHHLEHVDGRERREHRVAPLELQASRRQHGPRGLGAALPAHFKFIDRPLVRQALKEPRAHAGLQPHGPGVGLAAAQPVGSRRVGVQHLVLGDGRDHHGDGEGLHQLALRLGRAGAGGQLLLQHAVAVELRQHLVERGDQAADFVAAVPLCAQGVVAALAHLVGHAGQLLQGLGDLACHQCHQTQDAAQQHQCRAQVQPHARKQAVHPLVQQALQVHDAHRPGIAQSAEHLGLLCAHLGQRQARFASGNALQQGLQARQRRLERLALRAQGRAHLGRPRNKGLVVVRLNALRHRVQPPHQREQLRVPLRPPRRGRRAQKTHRVVHRLQQLGEAQHHQRHHVVAVQVRVQDQVGLVAHGGEQFAPLAQQLAAPQGERRRIAPGRCPRGGRCRAGQLLQRGAEALACIAGVQLLVVGLAHHGQPGQHLGHQRRLLGRIQKLPQQAVAHHRRIGGAHDLLAREVDGQVLLVDQDAGDVDHRRQVQQIDEHELAAHTEAAQPARYAAHECHGVAARARPGGWPGLPTGE